MLGIITIIIVVLGKWLKAVRNNRPLGIVYNVIIYLFIACFTLLSNSQGHTETGSFTGGENHHRLVGQDCALESTSHYS